MVNIRMEDMGEGALNFEVMHQAAAPADAHAGLREAAQGALNRMAERILARETMTSRAAGSVIQWR